MVIGVYYVIAKSPKYILEYSVQQVWLAPNRQGSASRLACEGARSSASPISCTACSRARQETFLISLKSFPFQRGICLPLFTSRGRQLL